MNFPLVKPTEEPTLYIVRVQHIGQVVLPPDEVGGPLLLVAGFPFGVLQPCDIIFRGEKINPPWNNLGLMTMSVHRAGLS